MTETLRLILRRLLNGIQATTDEQLRQGIIATEKFRHLLLTEQTKRRLNNTTDTSSAPRFTHHQTSLWTGDHNRAPESASTETPQEAATPLDTPYPTAEDRRAASGGPADP